MHSFVKFKSNLLSVILNLIDFIILNIFVIYVRQCPNEIVRGTRIRVFWRVWKCC